MKKLLVASIAALFLSCFANAWAQADSDNAAAQTLIQNWFTDLKSGDVTKAEAYLAPQFVSIHTDGIVRDKAQEIELMKNLHMKAFNLTNFRFHRSGDVIIVTYKDLGAEQIDKSSIAPQAAGRMAVLQKQNGKWVIIGYANLAPIA